MNQAFSHPIQKNNFKQLGHNYQQLGTNGPGLGISFDFWDSFREETLDPWVDSTLESVGLTQEQIEEIKSDAGDSFNQELQNQQQDLLSSIIGAPAAPAPTVTQQFTSGLTNLQQSAVVKAIPGGLYTIGGVTIGLIALLVLRK